MYESSDIEIAPDVSAQLQAADIDLEQDSTALQTMLDGRGYASSVRYFIPAYKERIIELVKDKDPLVMKQIRDMLFGIAKDGAVIIGEKTYKLRERHDEVPGKWTHTDFFFIRRFVMDLFLANPELLLLCLENDVIGSHGSTSASLLGVLDHGLGSQSRLDELDITVASGEHSLGTQGINKHYVSLTQWHANNATRYASHMFPTTEENLIEEIEERKKGLKRIPKESIARLSAEKALKRKKALLAFLQKPHKDTEEMIHTALIRLNFPIAYLCSLPDFPKRTDDNDLDNDRNIITPYSDIRGEFAVKDSIPRENIHIILVPRDKINVTRRLIAHRARSRGTGFTPQVFALEDYQTATGEIRFKDY